MQRYVACIDPHASLRCDHKVAAMRGRRSDSTSGGGLVSFFTLPVRLLFACRCHREATSATAKHNGLLRGCRAGDLWCHWGSGKAQSRASRRQHMQTASYALSLVAHAMAQDPSCTQPISPIQLLRSHKPAFCLHPPQVFTSRT